jgi:hypothetical protein
MNIDVGLLRLAMAIGVGENNPRRAAALLLTLGRIGSVSLADDGLEEGLGSWFRLRNRLQSGGALRGGLFNEPRLLT